ncbi:MAG: hypothetical protein IJK58_01105 [Clostridia bacterium]|nr:hypothetical protein [Clostridia bacterium]
MKKAISLFFVLVIISVFFTSCGGNSAVGTYTLETIGGKTPFDWIKDSIEGDDDSTEGLLELFGVTKDGLNERFYVLTLEDGGKASVYSEYAVMYAGIAESEGVWTLDGDVLTVTIDGEDVIMTFKDGVLTHNFNGSEGVFKKTD